MHRARLLTLTILAAALSGCSQNTTKKAESTPEPTVSYFKVDPATAGTVKGKIQFTGHKPAPQKIEMDEDPQCARMHQGAKVSDESLEVNSKGGVANVFVYVKTGLEGKKFEPPAAPVTIDQNGCWFKPRVIGIQTGQTLRVTNSDPVTHNIHPLAQVNREWNHSQSQGDPPLTRRFVRQEIMIPVKCNIHHWMRAYIGAVAASLFRRHRRRRVLRNQESAAGRLYGCRMAGKIGNSGAARQSRFVRFRDCGFHFQRRLILAHIDVLPCDPDCRLLKEQRPRIRRIRHVSDLRNE